MIRDDLALVHREVLDWYAEHHRDLPWAPRRRRVGGAVSEVMPSRTGVELLRYDA